MEEIQEMSFNHLDYINNDLVIPVNETILGIDNGCVQTIVNISYILIEFLPVYNLV